MGMEKGAEGPNQVQRPQPQNVRMSLAVTEFLAWVTLARWVSGIRFVGFWH